MISYVELLTIPNEVICSTDVNQSSDCDISFPVDVWYNFTSLTWVDGDTKELIFLPWQNNTLPPYYPIQYDQVVLYYAKDQDIYRLPPRFILWSDNCEKFKRGYEAELEKDLDFMDRYYLELDYNASIKKGKKLCTSFLTLLSMFIRRQILVHQR